MKAKNLFKAAIIAGSAAAIFSCGGGGGGTSGQATSLQTMSGIAFDGYLQGSVVFADCYNADEAYGADGQLSSKDPRAVTVGTPDDLDSNPGKENFTLVTQCNPERIYLFGGLDTITNSPFNSVLIGSPDYKVINPVISLIVIKPELKDKFKTAFGITDNDFNKDYVGRDNPPESESFFRFAVALSTAVQAIGNTIGVYNVGMMEKVYEKVADVISDANINDLTTNLAGLVAHAFTEGLKYAKQNNSKLPYKIDNDNDFKSKLQDIIADIVDNSSLMSGINYYNESDPLKNAIKSAVENAPNDLGPYISTAKVSATQIDFMGGSVNLTNDGRFDGGVPYGTLTVSYDNDNRIIKAHLSFTQEDTVVDNDGTYKVSISATIKDRHSGRSAIITIAPVKIVMSGGKISDIAPDNESPVARLSIDGTDSAGNHIGSPVIIDNDNVLANIIYDGTCGSNTCLVFDIGKALDEIKNQGNIDASHPLYNVDLKGYYDLTINTSGELPVQTIVGAIHVTP